MSTSSDRIRLDYRPARLFWPLDLHTHVLSSIKGAERKEYVREMFEQGREDEIPDVIIQAALEPDVRRVTGAMHPRFMGGEYLPDLRPTEVEIARITIASTTQDVACVYAGRGKSRIYYRVVDEYEEDFLCSKTKCESKLPLTLGRLVEFFLGAWNLLDILEMNYGDEGYPPDEVRAFFDGSSEFYPDFGTVIEQRVEIWLQQKRIGFDEDDSNEDAIPETSAVCQVVPKP